MFTGNCEEDFKEWLENNKELFKFLHVYFDDIPDSMKWGVFVDFADSVGYWITMDYSCDMFELGIATETEHGTYFYELGDYQTRTEAREKALEKFDELYNNSRL